MNGVSLNAFECMIMANKIAGRNGIGIKHALENRIIGTKSRGVYEAPGMELLGYSLEQVYQAVLDRKAADLFKSLSAVIANQIYDGRLYDPSTFAAKAGINTLASFATGQVSLELYKGNIYFQALKECPAILYNEKDSSMEKSDGLNPQSSQGFVEVQSVEAISLANAKQIRT